MGNIIAIPYEHFELELDATTYSPKNALSMALACQLSYQSEDDIYKQLDKWGFLHFANLNAKKGFKIDTQGFVASNKEITMIVFRGSDSSRDWVTNLNTVTDPGPLNRTRVHEGFQNALFSVIMDLTKEVVRQNRPLWITGHSLGGALATILTAMYLERDDKVENLYTFGSPRVGNERFREQFNKLFNHAYRVVNGNDLVPHLPPEPFFSHVGQSIIFDEKGKRHDGELNFWQQIQINVKSTLLQDWGDGKLSHVERHQLSDDDGYIPRLLKDLGIAESIYKKKNY